MTDPVAGPRDQLDEVLGEGLIVGALPERLAAMPFRSALTVPPKPGKPRSGLVAAVNKVGAHAGISSSLHRPRPR